MRRRRVTVWIVGGCALVGAIAVASVGLVLNAQSAGGTTLVSGFRTAGETFDLGGRTIDRGRYVTAGTKVVVLQKDAEPRTVKAVELSGVPGLLFRRNSLTGAVEVLPRSGTGVELNAALHA